MAEKKTQTDPPAGAPDREEKHRGGLRLCPICDRPMHRSPTGHSCEACKAFFASDPFAALFDARNMGMTEDQLKRFRMACDHPYTCKCQACLEWWELVGPEPED